MQYQLENAHVRLRVKEAGAELCSLYHKQHNIEYLWKGDPQHWGRHAPLLFPVVGKLKENSYRLNERAYNLPQHGFARDLDWTLVEEKENSLLFVLQDSAETREKYPFHFVLEAMFRLEGASVSITYTVKNSGKQEMPFSIGLHPAFTCPLLSGGAFEDYYLEFEKKESLSKQLLQDGLRTGEVQPVLQKESRLPLSRELFREDALVFEGVQSNWLALHSHTHPHGVKVFFNNFPYLGIWTKSESSPFICIEPWYGVADSLEGQSDIRMKEGIHILPAEKKFSCTYSIEVF